MAFCFTQENNGDNTHIYRYTGIVKGVYIVFMPDGVRFFKNDYDEEERRLDAGCILFLPVSQDKESSSSMTNAINAVAPKNKTLSREQLVHSALNLNNQSGSKPQEDSWLAMMLLNFLAEMKYGRTFKDDPLFHKSYDSFMQNHLFRALSRYMDYIRCGHLISNEKNLITIHDFVKAERQWIETITASASDLLFHESSWFDDCADELKKVYEGDCCGLSSAIYESDDSKHLLPFAKTTADIASNWCFARYRLDSIFSICNGKNGEAAKTAVFVILLAQVLCMLLWVYIKCDLLTQWLPRVFVLLVAILLVYLISLCLTKKREISKSTIINLFLPRLFAGIASGWIAVGLNDIALKRSVTDYPELADNVSICPVGICMTILLFFFIFLAVRHMNPHSKSILCCLLSVALLALSYIYSIIIGIFQYKVLTGFWYTKAERWPTLLLFSFIAVFVGVFIQMLFQNSSITSSSDRGE